MTTYVTFGQAHAHSVNGKTFDKDCVAVIEGNSREEERQIAFDAFNGKFCFSYFNEEFHMEDMRYYPRGLIRLE
jgi:hypothetical protein